MGAEMHDASHLLPGTVVDHYQIVEILGEGGFGITYLVIDMRSGERAVLKEYFPKDVCFRQGDNTITPKKSEREIFARGLARFKEEATILARFHHPAIVKILGYFEANDTAYFIMEYEEGMDLAAYLKVHPSPLTQEEILSIMIPILEGLKEVHRHHYLHRDIKPANILLRNNNLPVLIDFGASKEAFDTTRHVTSMLTEGYAPLEQYSTDVKQQGPYTDIYAVAAVMYRMITGAVPPSAQTRSYAVLQGSEDPLVPLGYMQLSGFDGSFLYAIDRALLLKGRERPQSVQEFQHLLLGHPAAAFEPDCSVWSDMPKNTPAHTEVGMAMDSVNFFSYEGRTKRMPFLLHLVAAFLFIAGGLVLLVPTINRYTHKPSEIGVLLFLLAIVLSMWVFSAGVTKRSRDAGFSIALMIGLSLIPVVGLIVLLILLIVPSADENYDYQ